MCKVKVKNTVSDFFLFLLLRLVYWRFARASITYLQCISHEDAKKCKGRLVKTPNWTTVQIRREKLNARTRSSHGLPKQTFIAASTGLSTFESFFFLSFQTYESITQKFSVGLPAKILIIFLDFYCFFFLSNSH